MAWLNKWISQGFEVKVKLNYKLHCFFKEGMNFERPTISCGYFLFFLLSIKKNKLIVNFVLRELYESGARKWYWLFGRLINSLHSKTKLLFFSIAILESLEDGSLPKLHWSHSCIDVFYHHFHVTLSNFQLRELGISTHMAIAH